MEFHGRFVPCFGRRESQEHALGYLRGLLLGAGRKSVEPMALVFGGSSPDQPEIEQSVALAWQRFLTCSPWEAEDVQQEIQAVFNEEFVPTASQSPIGTVGVIDGSAFVKHGKESVGVQRQWCGRLGKKENCQVGVFLLGVTPAGSALLDHQLYLPETWAADALRRKKTRVPAEIAFQTKPQIAAALLARSSVHFDWITADEEFGRDGDFLDALERDNQRYLVEVPANTTVWANEPLRQTPDELVWQVSHWRRRSPRRPGVSSSFARRTGTVGIRVCPTAGVVGASPSCRSAGLAADPSFAGPRAGDEILHHQRRAGRAVGDDGAGDRLALAGGRSSWRTRRGNWGWRTTSAFVDELASPLSLAALAYLYVVQTRRDLTRGFRTSPWTWRCDCSRAACRVRN